MIVDKDIAQVDGIKTHQVELNNRRAAITVEQQAAVAQSVDSIRDLGYGVTAVKKTLPVLGMSCASCASSAQNITLKIPGIIRADVNYGTGNLQVEYLPNMVSPNPLRQAIRDAGYDLLLEENKDTETETLATIQQEKFEQLKRKTALAAVFAVPLVAISMFFMHMPYANLLMWLLSTPVVLWLGRTFISMLTNRRSIAPQIWILWSPLALGSPIFSHSSTCASPIFGYAEAYNRTCTSRLQQSLSLLYF